MAASFKLTVPEVLALLESLREHLGYAGAVAALVDAAGVEKATKLLRLEKGVRITKVETLALIKAIYARLPGGTEKEKILLALKEAREAFPEAARFKEAMAYVMAKIDEFIENGVPSAGDASAELPKIGAGKTITGWGPVNHFWKMADAAIIDGLAYMQSCNVRFFPFEAIGNAGEDVLGNPAKLELAKSRYLLGQAECRKRGIWFAPILFNDNAGDGDYQNGGVKLEKRMAQAKAFIDWVSANGDKTVSSITVVSEIQTDAGRQLEAYGLSKLAGFRLDYNGNGQPASKPSAYSGLLCYHVCDVGRWPSASSIWMNDCGPAIRAMNANGDLNGVGNPAAIEKKKDEAVARGQCVFAIYGFQVDGFDKPAIEALSMPSAPQAHQPEDAWPAELAAVKWLHADVRDWAQTAKMTASVSNGNVNFPYDKANAWPVATSGTGKDTNANVWAIVLIGGQWVAGTWEWLRKGQTSKPVGCLDGSKGDHFKVSPLSKWNPKPGERFYVMASGHARTAARTVKERSNPVKVSWP